MKKGSNEQSDAEGQTTAVYFLTKIAMCVELVFIILKFILILVGFTGSKLIILQSLLYWVSLSI